jgi:predicted N-acetyltransferase YhbS
MFITRMTRHDKDDVRAFLKERRWEDANIDEGVVFIARDGGIVGSIRLVEVAPQMLIVEDVLVTEPRRGQGIGRQIVQAAMNSRGGTMYLCAHDDVISFYEKFGFTELPFDVQPEVVQEYFKLHGDYPTEPGHDHYFMTAR